MRRLFNILFFFAFMNLAGVVFAKSSSSVILTSSLNPSAYASSLTFTAAVAPAAATGTISFKDGSGTLSTVAIRAGQATYSTATLAAGSHSITAFYSGNFNDASSTSSVLTQTVSKANTTVTLVSSANPSVYGSALTLTATVTPSSAAGTVTFIDGSTILGTGTISSGRSTFSISNLAAGSHSLTASFGGSTNYNSSASTAISQVVNPASATVTLAASMNPSTYGSAVTFTATLTPSAAIGTVTFNDGGTSLGTATISAGKSTFSISTLAAGSHSITAVYSGDANDQSGTSKVLTCVVNKANAKVALGSSANPSNYGSTVTFSATVSPVIASGTVVFKDGTTMLQTVTLSGGEAVFGTATLTATSHSITATYSGDANDSNATSSALMQKVSKANASIALNSSANPSGYGSAVTFTAAASPLIATGTITFKDGSTTLGAMTIGNGTAAYSTPTLAVGLHSITASYSGDANDNTGTSPSLAETVSKANTTVLLAPSANPSTFGAALVLSATVTPQTATGSVTFADGATVLGTAAISGGHAVYSISTLTTGSHSITASYGGDANDASSSSGMLAETINKVNSSIAIASSQNPSAYASPVTLTTTVTPASATGTISFTDGSTTLGSAVVSGGTASYTMSTLLAGPHSITASYGGDANDAGSTSATLAQTVNKLNSTLAIVSSQNPSTYGSSVSFTVTTVPAAATGTVTFIDGGTTLGNSPITGGIATYGTSTLAAGPHSITASYGGDTNDNSSSSSVLTESVNKISTAVSLTSASNPSIYGSSVMFTATLTPGTATGAVTFTDGSATLGTGAVSNGTGTYSADALATGSHSIAATYGGDINDNGVASTALSQTVNPVYATVALGSSSNPSSLGSPVTFTAVVTPATATGTVTFADGTTNLGAGTISSGIATYSTSTLALGSHSITATYGGDTNDGSSSPIALTQVINAPALVSLAINPVNPSLTAGSGQQLIAQGTFSDTSVQDLTVTATWSSSDSSVASIGSQPGSQGFTMAIGAGTATVTAVVGSVQTSTAITVQPATGPNLAYSARTDNCVNGSQSGCVSGETLGQAGATLMFQEGISDPIPAGFSGTLISSGSCPSGSTPSTYPAYCPAPMNSTASDPDFGAFLVMGTDDNTNSANSTIPYRASWNMRSDGEWDAFSWDETLLLTESSFGGATILNVNPAAIHAQTCATGPGCVNSTGIFNASSGGGDSTHLAAGGNWSFSRVPGEVHVLYERAGVATQVNKLVISSSITTPGTGGLSRSLYVDFTADSPTPCSVMESAAPGNPTTYSASWAGSFQVADDGSISYGMTGGYDWSGSWTVTPIDTFVLPTAGNAGNYGFQATAITGSGMTGASPPAWCQSAGCSVVDASSSGSVTWTNIDKLYGQGAGFDVLIYRPAGTSAAGCTRINTRLGKIYRGTGNAAPAGYMTTNDEIACTRAGSYPSACIMPDRFAMHEVEQPANGQFVEFSPAGGGTANPPGRWNSGTLSCQASNTSWQGAYSPANTYAARNIVSYSGLYYTALTNVPSGNGHAPSGTTFSNSYWSNTESYCNSYVFDTTSTLVAPITDWAWSTGHAAFGYLHKYWGPLYRSMLFGVTCPDCAVINGRLNPGTPMLLAPLPCDDHGTYRNSGTDDLAPIFSATTDVPAWTTRYVAACYDELCAFDPAGSGLTYRFGHTYNTGSSSYFQIQNNIGVNSPLGDLIAFGTDMMGSRGSNAAPNTSCNNLRGQYRPSANGAVSYGDHAFPTTNNAGGNIFQATGCGADTPGSTCNEGGTLPNWDSACSTTCTDGGVTWTNVGPNSCRGDIVIMDASQAHAAP